MREQISRAIVPSEARGPDEVHGFGRGDRGDAMVRGRSVDIQGQRTGGPVRRVHGPVSGP